MNDHLAINAKNTARIFMQQLREERESMAVLRNEVNLKEIQAGIMATKHFYERELEKERELLRQERESLTERALFCDKLQMSLKESRELKAQAAQPKLPALMFRNNKDILDEIVAIDKNVDMPKVEKLMAKAE